MARKAGSAGIVAFALALALGLPAVAAADDAFVDADTGSDSNPCTEDEPCASIHVGIAAAGPSDTVHVDPGSYNVGIQVDDGISVVADPFADGVGQVSLNGGGFPAVEVLAGGAGTIRGLSITSTTNPVIDVSGAVTLTGNRVLVPTLGTTGIGVSALPADAVVIDDNDFFGGGANQRAIEAEGADLTISGNRIGDTGNRFNGGVFVEATTDAEIVGNQFRGMVQHMANSGQAIYIQDATATIVANSVRESVPGTVIPITLNEVAGGVATGASLQRNELYGQGLGVGVIVNDTAGVVTLDGDLITGFSQGLDAEDAGADSATDADVSVTGATLWENSVADIAIEGSDLSLDSTIMSIGVQEAGTVSCTITFSRASADVPSASGCADVQTVAGPQFVDPAPVSGDPDLHLTAGSPMLDAGNPAAPTGTLLDIDGLPRLADGDQLCPQELRRDIGADEFGDLLDCDPPQTRVKGKKRSKKPRVRFRLRSDEPGSTFRCKLDSKPYRNCRARYRTPRLEPGKHKLKVKATDAAGNQDPTAAVKRFRVLDPN